MIPVRDAVIDVAMALREFLPFVHADNMLGVDGKEPRTDLASAFRSLLESAGVRAELNDDGEYEIT